MKHLEGHDDVTDNISVKSLRRIDEAPMTPLVWRVSFFTLGGMFTDGYILGHIGIALAIAAPLLNLNALWLGLLAASTLVGILIGAPIAGRLADRFGRKNLLAADFSLLGIGALAHLFINDQMWLLVLRLFMGIAIGAEYAIGAALLSEIAPARRRGVLLSMLNGFWIVGFVSGFVVAYVMRSAGGSWQWILASAAVPALIVLLLRIGSPESPRWLISKGRRRDALAVVNRHFGPEYGLAGLDPVQGGPTTGFRQLFRPQYIRRTLFAGIFWACQVLPLFALTIFLPQVFEALGVGGELGAELFVNGMLLLGAIGGVWAVAALSRRGYTIGSFVIVAGALAIMAVSDFLPSSFGLGAFAVFVLVGSSATNLEYVYPSEIFPTEVRATGVGFAAGFSRLGAAASTFLLPIALDRLGTMWTMVILAAVAAFGALVTAAWAPETKGLSLAEAGQSEEVEQ